MTISLPQGIVAVGAALGTAWGIFEVIVKRGKKIVETAKDARSVVTDLNELRKEQLGNKKSKSSPPRYRLRAMSFRAALADPIPAIQVSIDIINHEKEPLILFAISVGVLHIDSGNSLTNIDNITLQEIAAPGDVTISVTRSLTSNEIRMLSDVRGRPAAEARATITALVSFRGHDHVLANPLNEVVKGQIEGDPPNLLLTKEEMASHTAMLKQLADGLREANKVRDKYSNDLHSSENQEE